MLLTGSSGKEVAQLQQKLVEAGVDPGPLDGLFGSQTRRAVVELQRYCGLAADGIAGPKTRRCLGLLLTHRPQPGSRLGLNFAEQEFACRCCGLVRVNTRLVDLLQKLRSRLGGKAVVITSGYRCPQHNQAVGGAGASQHLLGNAADITVAGVAPAAVAEAAGKAGFPGVGRYKTFTHVDVRPGSPVRW